MRSPTAADVVRVWELGRDRPSWYRGLLLLAPGYPGQTFRELATLTIGQRNIRLFALRRRLFGRDLSAVVACPRCGQQSEFSAHVDELCPHQPPSDFNAAATIPQFSVELPEKRLQCRCPTSHDLAFVAPRHAEGSADGRAELFLRTLLSSDGSGGATALSVDVLHAWGEALIEHDPLAELAMGIDCANCGHSWVAPFDPVNFVWIEMANAAQRLLSDVHVLADAYGWREMDILSMGAARRKFYIEKTVS